MKYVWISLGGLLGLLILMLLFGKTKLRIAASATRVKVLLTVCGIRIWILPLNKGILKNGRDSKIIRKMQEKRTEKKELKRAMREAGEPMPSLPDQLQTVFTLIRLAQNKFQDKLSIRVRAFKLEIASPDAAQTAILYGSVIGLCSWFWEWIQATVSIIKRKRGAMVVVPNYLKTQSSMEIDITLKIHTLRGLFNVFSLIDAYKVEMQKAEDKAYDRQNPDED